MNDLIVIEPKNVPSIFQPGGLAGIIEKIEAEARSIAPDVSTKKGRDQIRSTAANVAKTKTYLDGLGKDLTADLKRQTAAVDAERAAMRARLDALKEEVRRPLTDWEQAEENRIHERRAMIAEIVDLASYPVDASSGDLSLRLSALESFELTEWWQEFEVEAARAKESGRATLTAAIEAAKCREAEQAELARLRAEAAEREKREREERIAREAAEKARIEAERKAKAEADAVERAAREERISAENERLKAERDREAAERRAIEAEQRAKQAEADAKRREQQAAEQERARAKAEADRVAAEAAKRAADKAHVLQIKREVAVDLMKGGISGDDAKTAVLAILRGEVRHTEIRL